MSDLRASLAAVRCFFVHLPLFFRREPRTPLRVLGIIALDTLHVVRHSRRLPRPRIEALALFIDFEGCANAAWDRKRLCGQEWAALRERLNRAGLDACVDRYLARLGELESCRPAVGGDHRQFAQVRAYRESVARLSITTVAAVALNPAASDVYAPAHGDGDLDALYRILMQCQIIDDVVDHAADLSAGLPSFLTASTSLEHGLALTAAAARDYGVMLGRASASSVFPLRVALRITTALAAVFVWTYGITHSQRTQESIWRWTTSSRR